MLPARAKTELAGRVRRRSRRAATRLFLAAAAMSVVTSKLRTPLCFGAMQAIAFSMSDNKFERCYRGSGHIRRGSLPC